MRRAQNTLGLIRAAAVLGMVGAGAIPSPASRADPLDASRISADAGIVVHVDLDRLRETKTYGQHLSKLIEQATGSLPPEMARFKDAAGVNVQDLHDVTAYALSDPNHLLFLVHAKMDPAKVTAAIKQEAGESQEVSYGKHKGLRWGNKDETVFATFHDDGTLVLARSDEDLHKALDALDGKAERLKPESRLAGKSPAATKAAVDAQERPVLFVGITRLDKLAAALGAGEGDDELPPFVKKIAGGWLSLGESGADVVMRAAVSTTDAESAQTMQQAVDGLKAMIQLAAGSDGVPEMKLVSELLRGVTTSRADHDLSLRIVIPVAKLPEMLQSLHIDADDKGEPGEKHRVRLQINGHNDKERKGKEEKEEKPKANQ